MNKKRFLVFFMIAVFLVFGLAACERSLAPSGGATPTSAAVSEASATPSGTENVMEQIWLLATQTAMAEQAQSGAQTTPGAPTAAPGTSETSVPGEQPTEAVSQPEATTAPTPTTAAAVTVPSPTPGIPKTYVLQGGEFPFCIARRFNVNQYELLSDSGLSLNSRPQTGYQLRIPQTGHPFDGNRSLRSHPTTYTVSSGDTLNSIACLYGDISPDAIAYANSLSSPYKLTAGQKLQIP